MMEEKVQKEFEELYKKYGLNNLNKSMDNLSQNRSGLSENEERNFVNDCFDIYERIGFAETFETPYFEDSKLAGMKFSVINRVKDITEDEDEGVDLAFLPM